MAWINRPLKTLVRVNIMQPYIRKPPAIISRVLATTLAQATTDTKPRPYSRVPVVTRGENLVTIIREGISNYHNMIAERFEKHGPIYKEVTPDGIPIVHISNPDDFEKVFRAEKSPSVRPNFINSVGFFVEKGLPEGILGNDEHAARHRSAISPLLLRPNEVKEYLPSLLEVASDTVSQLKSGRNYNIGFHFLKWSTEGIGVVMFARRIGVNAENPTKNALAFIDAVGKAFDIEAKLMFSFPFHKYFKTPLLRRLYGIMNVIWDITTKYIDEAKLNPTKNEEVMGSLQKMMRDRRNILSETEIKQMTSAILGGGVETTYVTAINALNNLSLNQDVQQKLYEEIQRVLPKNKKPTPEDLAKDFPYLKSVVKESLRVTPTGPGFLRVLQEPIVLGGYEIPAGVKINLSTILSNEMAKSTYGEDYESFKPERWLRENTAKIHPFASIPFGFGSRKCVGRHVIESEVLLLLISMLQRFKIEKSRLEEDKVKYRFVLLMKPDGPFNLTLKEREYINS